MFNNKKKTLVSFGILLSLCTLVVSNNTESKKKVIVHSWDMRMASEELVAHLGELEKLPIDGISIFVYPERTGSIRPVFSNMMYAPAWEKEWFNGEVENLLKISAGKLKHNFLFTRLSTGRRIPWDSDDDWEACANNFGVMAWLAKKTGARGLVIDPEDYHKTRQYTYIPADGNFEDVAALARKRGRNVMRAIGTEYPDATLLSFWLLSLKPSLYESANSWEKVEKAGDLWAYFVNGMLDEMPREMTLVDATENAYRYLAEYNDFYVGYHDIASKALRLVAPENHDKYRLQVQVGFGLYLESYAVSKSSQWYMPELHGSRLHRFRSNFLQAMTVADEYVWFCSERHRFIKWRDDAKKLRWNYQKDESPPHWEDSLPGFFQTVESVRDSNFLLENILSRIDSNELNNLVANPHCRPSEKQASTSDKLPRGWTYWQGRESKGTFKLDREVGYDDNFSARVQGAIRGSFILKVPVKPGKMYAVSAVSLGGGDPGIRLRWQLNNKWVQQNMDKSVFFERTAQNGWRRAIDIVEVPDGVNMLAILLSVKQYNEETAWFDNVGVYEID